MQIEVLNQSLTIENTNKKHNYSIIAALRIFCQEMLHLIQQVQKVRSVLAFKTQKVMNIVKSHDSLRLEEKHNAGYNIVRLTIDQIIVYHSNRRK